MQLKQKAILEEHPSLPREMGKEAFNMDQSVTDSPTRSESDSDMTTSNLAMASLM